MTLEEFELENQDRASKTKNSEIREICDPWLFTGVRDPGCGRGLSTCSNALNPHLCVMVDEDGFAKYMVVTEDGRWIPAEDY